MGKFKKALLGLVGIVVVVSLVGGCGGSGQNKANDAITTQMVQEKPGIGGKGRDDRSIKGFGGFWMGREFVSQFWKKWDLRGKMWF